MLAMNVGMETLVMIFMATLVIDKQGVSPLLAKANINEGIINTINGEQKVGASSSDTFVNENGLLNAPIKKHLAIFVLCFGEKDEDFNLQYV